MPVNTLCFPYCPLQQHPVHPVCFSSCLFKAFDLIWCHLGLSESVMAIFHSFFWWFIDPLIPKIILCCSFMLSCFFFFLRDVHYWLKSNNIVCCSLLPSQRWVIYGHSPVRTPKQRIRSTWRLWLSTNHLRGPNLATPSLILPICKISAKILRQVHFVWMK